MADGQIVIDTRINQTGIQVGLKSISDKLKSTADQANKIGKGMSTYITAPFVAGGAAAIKMAVDQQSAFAQVSTLLTGSSKQMDDYKQQMRNASNEMGVSFKDYASSVYDALSSGVKQGDAIQFVNNMTKLARGGFTDLATATDVVTTTINAYGMKMSDTGHIMDDLINTQNLGKTTVDELARSIGTVIPLARSQSVSFDQLSAAMSVLTTNGIKTSESVTDIQAMLTDLGHTGTKADKLLRKTTGKSFADLSKGGMTLTQILGKLQEGAQKSGLKLNDAFSSVQGGAAALTLMANGGKQYGQFLQSMGKDAGATTAAFNIMNKTVGQKSKKALVELQNSAAAMGDIILPALSKIVDKVTSLITQFSKLNPTQQKAIMIFGAIAAAIGPLVVIIAQVIQAVSVLAGVFSSALLGPVLIVIGIIAALVAAFVLAYNHVKWFHDGVNQFITAAVKIIKQMIGAVTDFIKKELSMIEGWWKDHSQGVMKIVNALGAVIVPLFKFAFGIIASIVIGTWNNIKGVINGAIKVILGIVGFFIDLLTGNWKGLWKDVKQILSGAWEFIWNYIQLFLIGRILGIFGKFVGAALREIGMFARLGGAFFRSLMDDVGRWISGGLSRVEGFFKGILDRITSRVYSWGAGIGRAFQSMIGGIRRVCNEVYSFITSPFTRAYNFVRSIPSRIRSAFSSLHISIPHFRLPHVSFDIGHKKIGPVNIPYPEVHVNWYKNGGVFNGASLIGVGEAGPEAVVPLSGKQMQPFAEAIASQLGGLKRGATQFTLILGGAEYTAFVEDISHEQDKQSFRLKRRR